VRVKQKTDEVRGVAIGGDESVGNGRCFEEPPDFLLLLQECFEWWEWGDPVLFAPELGW